MDYYKELRKKIRDKSAVITVMGLGYVGLPIALEFAKKGFTVNGLDTSKKRVDRLNKGISYIEDVSSKEVSSVLKKSKFKATTSVDVIKSSDAVIVCVPTPLNSKNKPDISYMLSAGRTLKKNLMPGQIVVLESTTYPGTTRDVFLPLLAKKGLQLDKDFFLAFSPERIDPGNPKYDFTNIPKIIGGITENSTELGKLLYSNVTEKVVGVSSPETAEITKLLENTFRIVNIGLINEFAALCHKLNVDVWEVIKAAKTKPFGFMPFYPGPGVGGHCIPADPMYLSWKARKVGFRTHMIDLASKVNRLAPKYVTERIKEILRAEGKEIHRSRILLIGAAYKKDVNDLRESPVLDIIRILKNAKARWSYYDPHIPYLDIHGIKAKPITLTGKNIKEQDVVVILTGHSSVDYGKIVKNAKVVFDTRNVLEEKGIKGENIIKL